MGDTLISRLYRAAADSDAPLLRPFVSSAFAELLGECPGLAAALFGDLGSFGRLPATVQTDVPAASDVLLDLVIEGNDGFHLLIENRLAPDLEWYEERAPQRTPSHSDTYVAAARHRFEGRGRVLVLSRTDSDTAPHKHPPAIYCGVRTWSSVYEGIEAALPGAEEPPASLMRQFLHLLKEHDMNPCEPLIAKDSETILAFDQFARNSLKLLEEAVGRIRQEFDLRSTPNNRRLAGWYACSDRFQAGDLNFFFYIMFPPVPDLVIRPALQITKESSPRALSVAAEHGFRRGRWGSLWIERDFKTQHPFVTLPVTRQVEELVRFFQGPLSRLAKAGLVRVAPSRHEEATAGAASQASQEKRNPRRAREAAAGGAAGAAPRGEAASGPSNGSEEKPPSTAEPSTAEGAGAARSTGASRAARVDTTTEQNEEPQQDAEPQQVRIAGDSPAKTEPDREEPADS